MLIITMAHRPDIQVQKDTRRERKEWGPERGVERKETKHTSANMERQREQE